MEREVGFSSSFLISSGHFPLTKSDTSELLSKTAHGKPTLSRLPHRLAYSCPSSFFSPTKPKLLSSGRLSPPACMLTVMSCSPYCSVSAASPLWASGQLVHCWPVNSSISTLRLLSIVGSCTNLSASSTSSHAENAAMANSASTELRTVFLILNILFIV